MVDVSTATLVTRPARPNLDGGTHPTTQVLSSGVAGTMAANG